LVESYIHWKATCVEPDPQTGADNMRHSERLADTVPPWVRVIVELLSEASSNPPLPDDDAVRYDGYVNVSLV